MLAFPNLGNNGTLSYLDTIINVMFVLDIILQFFTAYVDEDSLELIEEKKVSLMKNLLFWYR